MHILILTLRWAREFLLELLNANRGSHACLELYYTCDTVPALAYLVREWWDDDSGSGDILYLPSGIVVYA